MFTHLHPPICLVSVPQNPYLPTCCLLPMAGALAGHSQGLWGTNHPLPHAVHGAGTHVCICITQDCAWG